LASAATTTANPIEARYEDRNYSKTTNPVVEKTDVAPQYKTVTRRQLVKAGGFTEWKEVVCEADVTTDLYRRIQQALIDRGFDVGSVGADGKIGAAAKDALVKFQKANGLPVGSLANETLTALGVK
jgi:peptidoglycan hydrolase-like protein with peptidoglycan-binding domain